MVDENKEIEAAVRELGNRNLITKKELYGLVGTTVDGRQVWFPDSLQRGYHDALTPINQRPKMLWQLAGIIGYFSDGNYNYLPRYHEGRDMANDLKVNLVANQAWKLTQENKELKNDVMSLKEELDKLKNDKHK